MSRWVADGISCNKKCENEAAISSTRTLCASVGRPEILVYQDDIGDMTAHLIGPSSIQLIARRELLLLQVHALAATDIELIAETVRRGLAMVTTLVNERSQASDEDVQQFMARGQLCHLIVTAGLDNIDAPWADLLQRGIRHPVTMEKPSPRRGRRRTAK